MAQSSAATFLKKIWPLVSLPFNSRYNAVFVQRFGNSLSNDAKISFPENERQEEENLKAFQNKKKGPAPWNWPRYGTIQNGKLWVDHSTGYYGSKGLNLSKR